MSERDKTSKAVDTQDLLETRLFLFLHFVEDDDRDTEEGNNRCFREKEGVLKMTGDDMTREISHFTKNSSLCNGVFKRCER